MSYNSLPDTVYQHKAGNGKPRTVYVAWDSLHRSKTKKNKDEGYYVMEAGPEYNCKYSRLAGPFHSPDAAQEVLDTMADEKGWKASES